MSLSEKVENWDYAGTSREPFFLAVRSLALLLALLCTCSVDESLRGSHPQDFMLLPTGTLHSHGVELYCSVTTCPSEELKIKAYIKSMCHPLGGEDHIHMLDPRLNG